MNMVGGEGPVIVTALFAGLLGSGHCFAMCGGIAAGLGAAPTPATLSSQLAPAMIFNFGRLISYAILGALGALLIGQSGDLLHIPQWSRVLRIVTAGMIFLIGLRFVVNIPLLNRIEQAGAGVWRLVRPLALRTSGYSGAPSRLLLGMCWGFLPCGLVYSILLIASSTASPVTGSLTMLAFGLGTLPSMLGVTWASSALRTLLQDRWARWFVAGSLMLLSGWTLVTLVPAVPMHGSH